MSERAPREREVDASYAPTSRAHVSQPKQTPAEQAQDAIVFFARETGSARTTLEEVHEAHAANDLDRWTQTRGRVESMLVRAQRSLDRARARSSDATPDALARLAAAENELEQLRQSVGSLGEAPTGFAAVSEETEILAAFDAPLEGGFRVGFEKKEATLKARMDRLAPADRRVLAERLRKQRPNDPIAAAFSRLTEARRQGLLEHLASAGQRDAQRREVALRSKESSLVPPDGSDAPQVAGPSDATPDIRPVIAPEPESLDTKLRRILEAGDSDAAIESAFADVVADLDGTTRRALAKRLETYRPGSGDEIAARFARLDRSLRQRICTGLHTEAAPDKLPAEIRGDLESATGTSLDHVNLHADPQGNAVAAAHGARAVAIGSDIYMGEGQLDATTDVGRELIAHEVAHVVQAQSQPGLDRAAAKRDGDSTDAAEIEANAFAAEFREHRGAMTWSPQVAMNHGAALHAPSQPSKQAPRPIDAPEVYLRTHRVKLWTTVEAYLQRVNLPSPSPRLTWRDDTKFIEETVAHLRRMNLFDRRESLLEVLYPLEAYTLIAPLLPLDAVYVPTVGSALAQLFEQAIVSSLRRLGPRWVDLAEHKPEQEGINDETKSLVAAPSLITSAPIDLAVRQGLTVAAVVELASAGKHAARSKAPRTLRPVTIEWQGKSDRALWNWVRAEPSDATPEEVAAKLWGDRTRQGWDGPASYYAYGLVQTGSLFAMPPSWARGFKEASDYAPVGPTDETGSAHFLALAGSKAADDVALAQAATKKSANADSLRLVEKLEDSAIQLEYVKTQVAPWNLALDVDVGLRWVANKQAEMTTASAQERSKWAPVIDQQAERLGHIKDGVKEVAARSKGQDPNSKTSDPFRRILTAYARAAATSFMGDVSDQLIKQANNEQALLTLTALRASTNDLSLVVGSGKGVDSKQVSRAEDLASESRKIQSEILAGKQVDQERLELATLQSQELALKLRIDQIRAQLRQLLDAAAAAGKGKIATIVAAFHGKFRSLDLLGSAFDNHLQMVESSWDYEASGADSIRDPEEHALAKRQLRRGALSRAQTRFDEIKKDDGLVEFLQEGANIVDAQVKATGWASICVQLLAMIGISFVASVAGGAVARTIAGWGVRAEAIESAAILGSAARRAQRAAGWSAGVAVEAGVNTAGQAAMQGVPKDGSLFKTWLENVITGGAGSLVLSKIGHDLEFAKDIERQTHSMWARVKGGSAVALAKTVAVSSHVIVNVAIAHQSS